MPSPKISSSIQRCSWPEMQQSGWGWEGFLAEADTGSGLKFPRWARGYVTYVIPVGMLIVFAMGYAPIIAKWAGLG